MTKTEDLYDLLGKDYLTDMFLGNAWTAYVDKSEKKAVAEIWKLHFEKNKNEIILDLGMGPGRWSKFFVSLGFNKVVGLDISSRMVEAAREYIADAKFKAVKGDMIKLPFNNDTFDKVFCFRAFKYVSSPSKAIGEIERVLKPKGSVVLELSNKSLSNRLLKFISSGLVKLGKNLPLESRLRYFAKTRFYSKDEVFKLIKSCGLRVISHRYFALLPSIPLPQNFTKLWIKLDGFLFNVLPRHLFSRSLIFLISK